jgi:hypothetical protein
MQFLIWRSVTYSHNAILHLPHSKFKLPLEVIGWNTTFKIGQPGGNLFLVIICNAVKHTHLLKSSYLIQYDRETSVAVGGDATDEGVNMTKILLNLLTKEYAGSIPNVIA